MTALEQRLSQFYAYVARMQHYREALALMAWDLRTGAPPKGVSARAEAVGTLSEDVFAMAVSERMEEFLGELEPVREQLDERTRALVRECRREFDRNRKIPRERYREFVVLTTRAESVWEEAKAKGDFLLFRPYLEQIVTFLREFVEYWGYEEDPYDALLDSYEPGVRTRDIDPLFRRLREETVRLVGEIAGTGRRPDTSAFLRSVPPDRQRELCRWILEVIGFDFEGGRLDETVHPFEISLNPGDVRVTTRYEPGDVRTALFGVLHEGGHALYEQGIDPDLAGTPLWTGASMGIHESQSRFWENLVGRSLSFWERYFGELRHRLGPEWAELTLEQFYAGINDVAPSLIRTEADEVTYNLHIFLRYDLERALIAGSLEVRDLPEAWREQSRALLGVVPEGDAEGVLQDVHWASGSFGYFPTYTLGNLYAAQLREAIARDLGDWDGLLREGELGAVLRWLRDRIHRYGKLFDPLDLLRRATGEEPSAEPLVRYLRNKYGPLYGV